MDCRSRLVKHLVDHDVEFEVREHTEAFGAQRVAAVDDVDGFTFAKVVMINVDGELHMLVLPAPERVDLDLVALVLGGRDVSLTTERDFAPRFRDCELGAMPPFGDLYGIPVIADTTLARNDRIVFEAGTHTTTIAIRWEDYARVVQPEIVDFGSVPAASAR